MSSMCTRSPHAENREGRPKTVEVPTRTQVPPSNLTPNGKKCAGEGRSPANANATPKPYTERAEQVGLGGRKHCGGTAQAVTSLHHPPRAHVEWTDMPGKGGVQSAHGRNAGNPASPGKGPQPPPKPVQEMADSWLLHVSTRNRRRPRRQTKQDESQRARAYRSHRRNGPVVGSKSPSFV